MNPAIKTALLAATLCISSLGAAGQEVTLTVLSHKVHETVSRGLTPGTIGGDVAGEWAKKRGVKLNWTTANIEPMHDKLFRELSLRESSIDLAFVINKFQTPRISTLLEPLGPWQNKESIDNFDGIPANLLVAVMYDGQLTAVPFRHATTGLHWNSTLFKERGLDKPPTTADELVEAARKLTYTRPGGTRVNGLTMNSGDEHLSVLTFLNMYGAEVFDKDLKVKANSPEMIKGLTIMAQLYKEGVLPSNYASVTIDEVITAIQAGRAAMAIDPFARYAVYNNPQTSKFPGAINSVLLPTDPAIKQGGTAMTEIWSMAIPKGSKNKELAWDLIRELSKPENTTRIALNGNGAVRPETYLDPRLQASLPYTHEESKAIAKALVVPSSFNGSLEALTVFKEESQAAVIGLKSPADAAASMQKRIETIVKK